MSTRSLPEAGTAKWMNVIVMYDAGSSEWHHQNGGHDVTPLTFSEVMTVTNLAALSAAFMSHER